MGEVGRMFVKEGQLVIQEEDGTYRTPKNFEMELFISSRLPGGACIFDYVYDEYRGQMVLVCYLRFKNDILYRLKLFFQKFRLWDYCCCSSSKYNTLRETCMWLIKREIQ